MHKSNWLVLPQWRLHFMAPTVLVALFAALWMPVMAQQAPATIRLLPDDAVRGLNGPQHNFDFLAPGVGGENYQTAGFFGQKLRPYLAGNAPALAHLNDYRRQKMLFLCDRLLAVGAAGLYGQQVLGNGEYQYNNSLQKVAIGAFAASVLATVFINRNTNGHLIKAVAAYNANLARSRVWPRLLPTALGLGAAPGGQPLLALRWALR